MSRSPSKVIPPMTASASPLLNPVLQAALENLDVQLEEELTRFRRQQRLQTHALRRKMSFSRSKPLQDQEIQLPQLPLTLVEPALPTSPVPAPMPADWVMQDDAAPIPSPWAEPMRATASLAEPPARAATLTVMGTDTTVLRSPVPEPSISEPAVPKPSVPEPAVPDDYLASSEELLRSIAEEDPAQRALPSSYLETLLTPLGIGSLLLLVLSAATLGYLVMNPTSLGFLATQDPAANSPNGTAAQPSPVPEAIVVPSPNLAAKEFVDLNLNTLSTLPKPSPAVSRTPAASPSPQAEKKPLEPLIPPATSPENLPSVTVPRQPETIAPAADSRSSPSSAPSRTERSVSSSAPSTSSVSPTEPLPQPVPAPVSEPAPRSEAPMPQETPQIAANSPSPARSNYYYVVAPYRSDSELNQVQQAVPDAYVRNFSSGASVQMGAFSDESKAQELVQELQQQGIQAEIRQPE